MVLTLGPRARTLLIVVLALAAAGGALMVLGRSQSSPEASPGAAGTSTPNRSVAAPKTPAAGAPKARSAGRSGPAATARASVGPSTPPLAAPPPAPAASAPAAPSIPASPATPATSSAAGGAASGGPQSDGLPAAVEQALASGRIVVIELYDPAAKIDGTALREASAGAQLAGVAFVSVDVTGTEIDSLNRRFGVIQDPAVLVLRPPGDLVVRIDGFADRDTVAQAAVNAAS